MSISSHSQTPGYRDAFCVFEERGLSGEKEEWELGGGEKGKEIRGVMKDDEITPRKADIQNEILDCLDTIIKNGSS